MIRLKKIINYFSNLVKGMLIFLHPSQYRHIIHLLRSTEVFGPLKTKNLKKIYLHSELKRYPKGTDILKEGETGYCCYLIIEGAVRVYTSDNKVNDIVLSRLEVGQIFGEQALLTATGKRNASVQAIENVFLLVINKAEFIEVLDKQIREKLKKIGKEQLFLKLQARNRLKPSMQISEADTICVCMQVSRGEIESAIKKGAHNLEQIVEQTGAGSVCGTCQPKIIQFLGEKNWFDVYIDAVQQNNDYIRTYRLKSNAELPTFKPGQYIIIQAQIDGYLVERSYSLVHYQRHPEYFDVAIKNEEQGLFSNWLFQHDTINKLSLKISFPLGNFIFKPEASQPAVCFVGGVGIAPIISFLDAMIATQSTREIFIDYSASSSVDYIYMQELQDMQQMLPQLAIHFRTTNEVGRITPRGVHQILNQYPHADVYICGSQAFTEFIVQIVPKHKHRIYTESFVHAGGPIE